MRASFATSIVLGIVSLAACGGASSSDTGDASDEALSGSCSNAVPASTICDRNAILAVVSGPRADVLNRGFTWLDARVPYNQGAYRDHYRTDCSGFVSMCWQTGVSYNTVAFSQGAGKDTLLGSYDDLVPGDALVYRNPDIGHTLLFAGWADASRRTACVIQEGGTPVRDNRGQSILGSSMKFGSVTTGYLQCKGFRAIRSNSLPASSGPGDGDEQDGDPGNAPPTSGEKPPAPGTGTCNRVGGQYCGNPSSNLKGDPDTLYVCDAQHHLEEVRACPNGCKVNPQGVDDECYPDGTATTQCQDFDLGADADGYCGSDDTKCCSKRCTNSYCEPASGSTCIADGETCQLAADCCGYDAGTETCAEDPNDPGNSICTPL